ncbi:hypothetical protein BDW02DRAFT_500392 [Decorospora gaudefroyi]|uniref:FAD-binding domain-containing protein n=1 Tax=Decorospora gaudefroyi TaxID=184978 RepID=A0A6A5KDZ5_9PLEO|nr:hypothetical protein BDW02DRAFT_500392 [Decorospora gaudefroyi]
MLSSSNGTPLTPRAHITNPPALEALRDCDRSMYDECVRLGNYGDAIKHYRLCESMAGIEYARNIAWGYGHRKGEYEALSPCVYMDLTQSLLEPVLVKWATGRGWTARFDTTLVQFVEEVGEEMYADGEKRKIVATVVDNMTGVEYTIRTRYLFGADGGRSTVAKILDLPFTTIPGGGYAVNVLLRADLAYLMEHRQGNLHILLGFEKDDPFISVARMVKPWTEWLFVFMPKGPDAPFPKRSKGEWAEIVKGVIDDRERDVAVEVLDVSGWAINETSADVVSKGNVFCLGDAIHRHPPTLGLGSNTCIQDAFNLAWKLSLVHRNLAAPTLLSTYNTERQPVAAHLVKESNDILRLDISIWANMGMQHYGASKQDRDAAQALVKSNTKEGRERRKAVAQGMRELHRELHSLGTSMGQLYRSAAVYTADEPAPFEPGPREKENPYEHYEPCTYPGRRLPHVLLGAGSRMPGPLTSTLDIAGKGQFSLFTGIGGEGWVAAAAAVEQRFGVPVKVVRVGPGLDWADVYLEWDVKRGVEEYGCVLVRPDYFVAWRAQECGDEVGRLLKVMGSILGIENGKDMVGDKGV